MSIVVYEKNGLIRRYKNIESIRHEFNGIVLYDNEGYLRQFDFTNLERIEIVGV